MPASGALLASAAAAQLSVVTNQAGAFVDISATGTPLSLLDDGEVDITTTVGNALFPAGTVRVGSNGGVRFRGAGTELAFTNTTIPNGGAFSSSSQVLLPFWDDINTQGGLFGEIYWQEVAGTLIIQWHNVEFFGAAGQGTARFQVQVPASGSSATHWARFLYPDIDQARPGGGTSATIGYQAAGWGNDAQFSFDTPGAVANNSVLSLVGNFSPPPPPPQNCVETTFANNNGGNIGGAVYFDLTVTQPVTLTGLETHYSAAIGTAVGVSLYTVPTTYLGNEGNQAAWTLAASDNGQAASNGTGTPTPITFAAPLNLTPGTYGIALVASGSAHAYTNGTGTNQNFVSGNGVLSLSLGAASNFPFLTPTFTPRVWNGKFCTSGPIGVGTNYCTANNNSTGQTGRISGSGSASIAANNLTLEASRLPNNAFGFFITSLTQGNTPNPGGSAGVLCLGGQIGRYVGPGQIKNTGASGAFSLTLNLNSIPTPSGPTPAVVGQTRNFQAWHRDVSGGSATSNFTNGLAVTFAQ